jgi:nucleoid-associated protein YgaU
MKKKYMKIKVNLSKFKTFCLFIAALILCISIGFGATAANFTEENNSPAYLEIVVKNGDTLWDLTKQYYQGQEDLRKIIYRIKEINHLEQAEIMPGQLIIIPQS